MRLSTLVIGIVFILSSFLFGQNNWNYAGNGARAVAMGNAFTGLADDATAIAWNSAGLTQLYSMEASIIGRLRAGSAALVDYEDELSVTEKANFQLNFASFVFPFQLAGFKVVGGLAYRTLYDFNNSETWKWSDGDEWTFENKGGIKAISPSIAVALNDMISLGTVFNIYTGSHDYSSDTGNSTSDQTTDYSGAGMDIGVLLSLSEKISMGANISLPTDIKWERGSENGKFNAPMFYSFGAVFRLSDQFLLTADYHGRPWSSSSDADDEMTYWEWFYGRSLSSSILDLNSFHLGMEYLLSLGDLILPLRAGFYTNPLYAKIDANGNQAKSNVLTLGSGLILGNIIIDGAFEFENRKYAAFDSNDEYFSDWSKKYVRFTLGGTIHFGKD